jgi:DNA invertase Pin-like site-specific DNA recombinase
LDKHKLILSELCESNNWTHIDYEEIISGDSVAMRPVFQKLLADIENGIFDAVAVVDIDRLGRGDEQDQGMIKKAFAKSDTLIITPQKVYDLNNDTDKTFVDFKTFLARQEYSQIVKRLIQGKKIGARQGAWTNGTPPYPYEYERWKDKYNQKGLVVNDDKLVIYRFIIDSVINDNKTPLDIAYELNYKGVLSPRNGIWHGGTVYRILLDETHLGKIISNKSKGDAHKHKKPDAKDNELIPKNQWMIIENCHEAVKTKEEHEKILMFASRLTKTPKRKSTRVLPLTGLIKCGLCGHTMTLYFRDDRKSNPESLKPCWYHTPLGDKCPNKGMVIHFLYEYIDWQILSNKQDLQEKLKDNTFSENKEDIDNKIVLQSQLLENKQKSLSRILDGFENGAYSLNQFKERKSKVEQFISDIQDQINLLQIEAKLFDSATIEDKLHILNKFETDIQQDNLSFIQKNKLYKSIIDSIIWTRTDNNIAIDVKFK